jgi:acyl transferase domain-containing protein
LIGNHNTVPTPNRPATPSSQSSDSAISVTQATPEAELPAPEPKLFVFSSPEQDGLARLAETYSTYLDQDSLSRSLKGNTLDEIEKMHNLAYTLASRRTIFNWRSFAVADSLTGLQTSLRESGLPKHGRSGKKPSCAFVFTGQGAQWYAMGRELLRHAVFRTSIAQADAYLASSLDCAWSLTEELCRDAAASRVNEPQISQPLCTALQVALVDLLRHWCLHPKAVVGHSSGEIGAAYAAGVLSREDAWRVAYWRGVRSAEINALVPDRKGAMMAAALPEEQARQYLGRVKKGGEVVVACINSPNSVTISGDDSAVAEVEKLLAADNIWCRKLLVKTAYHSPHMQLIADQYRRDIQDIRPVVEGQFDIAVFSSVSGSQINPEKMGTADYWVKNLVNPVRFSAAVSSLLKPQDARSRRKGVANVEALVEIGPHSALQGPLRDILAAVNESYVGSVPYTTMLQRGVNALQTAITAAGRLWSAGFELDLDLVNSMEREALHSRPLVTLPRYPFNHKRRYWREPRAVRWAQGHSTPRTDLLGQKTLDYSSLMPTWKNLLCPSEIPWLLDHKVHGLLVMPGAVSIAMVMEACRDTADPTRTLEAYEFRDIIWHKPIIFESPDAQIQISLQLSPYKIGTKTATTSTWTRFSITTIGANQEATEHCSGFVERKYVTHPGEVEKGIEAAAEWERYKAEYEAIKARPTISLTARTMYDKLETHGIQFGPVFRNLSNMQSGEGFMQGEIKTPDTAATMPEGVESALPLHPTVLDASFQMLAATARGRSLDFPMLPSSIESLYVSATAPTAAGTVLKGYCTRVPESAVKASGCSVLWTESGDRPVLVLKGLIVAAAPGPQSATNKAYARLDWVVDVNHSQLPAQLGVRYEKEYAATARLADKVAAKFMREALALVGAPEAIKVENLPVELRNYIAWMRSLSDSVAALDGIGHGQSTEPAPDADVLSSIVKIGTQINSILMSHETKHTVISKTLLADFINRSLGRSVVDSTVVEILDQAGNINPNLEILELASGSNTTVATEVLKRLSGKYSRVAKYIWTGRDGEAVEAARNNLSKPGECIDFKTLEVEGDIQAQGFIPGKFDYIILDDLLLTTSDLDAALKNIKKLLKPDGKLIIQAITKAQPRTAFVLGLAPPWWREGASGERLDEARWDELLRANGFTGVNQAFADSDDPAVHQLSVMLSSATRETAFEYTDVLLVTPATPSPKVARLAENCAARLAGLGLGLSPATLPWTELTDEYVLGKTVVVSLIELDGDVFFDLAPALFHVTKAMALRAGGVLWLTQAGHVSGTAPPGHSVSMGLFRAVRSEYEAKPLASLDLSARVDLASAGAADLVTRLFTTLFAQGDIHAPDKEFAEDNGVVYVQRVVEDIGLAAARATTGVMPQPVTDRLFQEGRKLVMTVGQIGVLDSLQFEDNYECAGPLPQDKVEVKVLYTGMSSRPRSSIPCFLASVC